MTTSPCGLKVDDLSAFYNGKPVFKNLSFTLAQGGSLAIVGESGCGKSTLLAAISGFLKDVTGSITWMVAGEQKDISTLKTAFVWQQLGLFPWKKVKENLELPLLLQGSSRQEREEKVRQMLEELELTGLENKYPQQLSGGQKQRLAIGRSLITEPDVLFMDEPFSALDALLREHLQDFLLKLKAKHPVTIVFVTHDLAEATYLASHILVLGSNPTVKLNFIENKFCATSRESEGFFEVIRQIHQDLRQARSQKEAAK